MYGIQVTVIYSCLILVTVTSEGLVKKTICKTWTVTMENSAEPGQSPQNAASDQDLHCLLKVQEVKSYMAQSYVSVQDDIPGLHSETIDPPVLSVL